jgi:hypothetical protein
VTVVVQVSVSSAHQEDQEAEAAFSTDATEEMLSSTGQTVVETATTAVTSTVDSAGQLVISGGQLVTVLVWVSQMVEVVNGFEVGGSGNPLPDGAGQLPDGAGQLPDGAPAATAPTRIEAAKKRILSELICWFG